MKNKKLFTIIVVILMVASLICFTTCKTCWYVVSVNGEKVTPEELTWIMKLVRSEVMSEFVLQSRNNVKTATNIEDIFFQQLFDATIQKTIILKARELEARALGLNIGDNWSGKCVGAIICFDSYYQNYLEIAQDNPIKYGVVNLTKEQIYSQYNDRIENGLKLIKYVKNTDCNVPVNKKTILKVNIPLKWIWKHFYINRMRKVKL